MPKFNPSDDGKVIDGKTVVFLYPEGAEQAAKEAGTVASKPGASAGKTAAKRSKQAAAAAQGKALASAAKAAVPFCENCEKLSKQQAKH